jgi:hypothetical protein
MDNDHHKADSEAKYKLYFNLLQQKINEYGIEPRHIYNMDEKGFMIGVLSKMRRIFSRQLWETKAASVAIQDGNRDWITLIAAVCADGSHLPPSLI